MKSCKAEFSPAPATFPPKIQYRQEALDAPLWVFMGVWVMMTHFLKNIRSALLAKQAPEATIDRVGVDQLLSAASLWSVGV